MVNKIIKYSPEWEKKIKYNLIKKVEHIFKKDENKLKDFTLNGEKVLADAGEKIEVNEVELLIAERKKLIKELDEKKQDLKNKSGYTENYAKISLRHDKLETSLTEWKSNLKIGKNYTNQYNSFLQKGTGITNPYKTDGWVEIMANYNKNPTTVVGITNPIDYTNLYEGKLWTGDSATSKDLRITEQEAIKFITYTLKVLEKIDKTEFDKHLGIGGTVPSGITIDYKKIGETTATGSNTAVAGWLKTLQDHSKALKETTDNKTGRKEYSFGHNFVKDDETGMLDANAFNKNSIDAFFELINFFNNNSNWLGHANVQNKVIKDIEDDINLTFIPAMDSSYANNSKGIAADGSYTESKLNSWGQESYWEEKFKNSNKKTGFFGDIPKSDWEDKAIKLEVKGGLKMLTSLVENFFDIQHHTILKGKREKISDSFPTDNLYADFFDHYSSFDPDDGSFSDGTNSYTLYNFPNYYYEKEVELYDLKAKKKALLKGVREGGEELIKAEKEVDDAKKVLKDKETEIDNKITETITAKRKILKDKFKVSDTETNDFTDDNKITFANHHTFQTLIKDIRFLVNNDEEQATDKTNEDNAYQSSQDILDKVNAEFHWVDHSWQSMPQDDSGSFKTCKTDEQRIKAIKEHKGNLTFGMNLSWYHDKFVELAQIIILEDWQIEAQKKLKAAIDNQTPEETIQDWTNLLKKYDSGLEAIFNEDKINKWKQKKEGQDAFNNLTSLEKLIKKVCIFKKDAENKEVFDKINADFISFMTGKDSSLKTLTDLIDKKEPKEVILLIHQWEFNQLDETKKKERYLKFAWSELGGKKEVDSKDKLEDSEKDNFDKYLYQCAIGKINEASLKKPTQTNDDTGGGTGGNQEMSALKEWLGFGVVWKSAIAYTGILLLIGGVLTAIFWKNLTEWWNGSAEESETAAKDEEEEGEE